MTSRDNPIDKRCPPSLRNYVDHPNEPRLVAKHTLDPRIETVAEGGVGGSATVLIQLRSAFPGPGGMHLIPQDVTAAFRIGSGTLNHVDPNDLSPEFDLRELRAEIAFDTFVKHCLIKKLDDYFLRSGQYHFSHIPRPLGCTRDGGYLYEWVHGQHGYNSRVPSDEPGRYTFVELEEANEVGACFGRAGVNIYADTVETDTNAACQTKNIICQELGIPILTERISLLWKRIDFGNESLPVDYSQMRGFIVKHEREMRDLLDSQRVEMMLLGARYLGGGRPLDSEERAKLIELLSDYRKSSLDYMSTEGVSPVPSLKECSTQRITKETADLHTAVSFSRELHRGTHSSVSMEVRRGFGALDGRIFTVQAVPTMRVSYDDDPNPEKGLELFLRHFIVKKCENAFIAMGRYNYPHVARPLGHEGRSYIYESQYGAPKCTRELIQNSTIDSRERGQGLADWRAFVQCFVEAGIDMESRLSFEQRQHWDPPFAQEIIVRQPRNGGEDKYISRMWKRVNFDERSVSIDFDRLEAYLACEEQLFRKIISSERFNTMVLAIAKLTGTLSFDQEQTLREGAHEFRLSALRHLNYVGSEPPPPIIDLEFSDLFGGLRFNFVDRSF